MLHDEAFLLDAMHGHGGPIRRHWHVANIGRHVIMHIIVHVRAHMARHVLTHAGAHVRVDVWRYVTA